MSGESSTTFPDDSTSIDDAGVAVVCESVSRVYIRGGGRRGGNQRPDVEALTDVSLEFHSGELTVVAGPSGSGKSTLLHLLAALDTPTSGRVSIDGTTTDALSEHQRAALRLRSVGIVFQQFHLLDALSAKGNVAIPLLARGVKRTRRRERAEELLSAVDMADRLDHRPSELSGGERQRVAIARALANDPAVIVADEPTGQLDTETGDRILDLLTSVGENRPVIVASHDERVIDRADRVIQLRDGSVVNGER
jgi:putative ABC transport system ATP-binding protein